ncbi:MAG: hypothetical protein AAGN66_17840 [Acidobacteriota bacterium]
MRPATGNAAVFGLGWEPRFGQPAGALTAYDVLLPLAGHVMGTEAPSGAINKTGYVRAGIPGDKGGNDFELHLPLSIEHTLEFFSHYFGSVVHQELVPGTVYRDTFTPLLDGLINRSAWGLLGLEPSIDRRLLYGIRLAALEMAFTANEEVDMAMTGHVQHGSRCGLAVADVANTGTYTELPALRGPVKTVANGAIHIQVTRTVAGGGLRWKVEQTDGAPTWTGPEHDARFDAQGHSDWVDCQGADGLDLGLTDDINGAANWDPLEVVFPGTSADLADLAIGDTFTAAAPGTWPLPAMPLVPDTTKVHRAHLIVRHAEVGGTNWQETYVNGAVFKYVYENRIQGASRTRYPWLITGEGDIMPEVSLEREVVDRVFDDIADRHERRRLQLELRGPQIDASYRKGIVFDYPQVRTSEYSAPISDKNVLTEAVTLVAETDGVNPPVTATVTSSRNYSPTPAE